MARRLVLAAALLIITGTTPAFASEIIDRNASGVKLAVNGKGEALVTYSAGGRLKRVLAWGAVNAIAPTRIRPQAQFKLDYAGGWGKYRKRDYAAGFGSACGAYAGPPLAWLVAVCTAPDGSVWALQSWQRALPNYGLARGTRATIIGPGVAPDVMWQGEAPGPYDAAADKAANAEQRGTFAAPRYKVN